MRRSAGSALRLSIRSAVADLGADASASDVEQRIREKEPELYSEWRRLSPDSEGRLSFLARVLSDARPKKTAGATDSDVYLWPIGTRQRWNLLAVRGAAPATAPDPLERPGFYLHNYGASDAVDVVVSFAGLWQEYIPRVAPGETVELEWSEERVHPSEGGLPPAEERGYPDPFNPAGDRQDNRCELHAEFVVQGHRRVLEGLLYFWDGSPPIFFQQTGSPEALDRARSIR